MKLTFVYLLSSFVALCIVPARGTGAEDVAENSYLIKRNKLWRRHFVKTMLTMLHYKPGEKSPKEKYEMMLEAFRPLHPEGARLETTVNFLNDDPRAVLKDCKLELHQKVIIPCEFQQPDFVNRHFGEILGSILWKPEIFNPDLQMRNFAFKFTYFTPRVLRNKMPLFRGCLVNDLFSHYAKHRDTNREQGIEEMTNETMKFIREIAIRKEDDVNNIDMRQLI